MTNTTPAHATTHPQPYWLSLRAQHFQSHTDTLINFAPLGQLTVLGGKGGSGKTALIRAIRWLCYNEPSGDEFIQLGEDWTKVTLSISNGFHVVRHRSKGSINRYIIVHPDGEQQVFEGFGTGVPLEVQRVTGIKSVMVGDMEIALNLAEQLDGPFLGKGISSIARARILGRLAGTEELDLAGKHLGTDIYRREQERKAFESDIKLLDKRLEGYAHLPTVKAQIDSAEKVLGEIDELGDKAEELHLIASDLRGIAYRVKEAETALGATEGLPLATTLLDEARGAGARRELLGRLSCNYVWAERDAIRATTTIHETSNVEAAADALQASRSLSERLALLITLKKAFHANWAAIIEAQVTLTQTSQVDVADSALGASRTLTEREGRLITLRTTLRSSEGARHEATGTLEATARTEDAARLMAEGAEGTSYLAKLRPLHSKVTTLDALAQGCRDTLRSLEGVEQAALELNRAAARTDYLRSLYGCKELIKRASSVVALAEQVRAQAVASLSNVEREYEDFLEITGTCPLCGNELTKKEEDLKHVS